MNLRWIKLKKNNLDFWDSKSLKEHCRIWTKLLYSIMQKYFFGYRLYIFKHLLKVFSCKCFPCNTHVMPQSSSTISISTWGKWCASDGAPPSLEPSLLCSEHVPSAPGRQKNILKHEHQLSFCWTCSSYNNNLYGFQKIELVANRFKC